MLTVIPPLKMDQKVKGTVIGNSQHGEAAPETQSGGSPTTPRALWGRFRGGKV